MKTFWKRTVGTFMAAGLLLSCGAFSVGCSNVPKLTEADWNWEFNDGARAQFGDEYKNFLSWGGYNYSVTLQKDEGTETKQYLVQSDFRTSWAARSIVAIIWGILFTLLITP